ncbi:MAG: DUF448 domain-containing protein [Deltaproteobacteria bacterium]|nr:DUF448 domain-containing protein [Deltaproteobacteria bacterium]MBW2502962.1 DUF448 domain-containing protein [Deltaproteobacteria bacterium]
MIRERRQPQRTCLGCRQSFDQKSLARLAMSREGQIVIDLRNRLPGRGAYVCLERRCLEKAVHKQILEKAFRRTCQPIDLAVLLSQVRANLSGHMASLIGMARKSAQLVAGGNAVLDALAQPGQLDVVILAKDAPSALVAKTMRKASSGMAVCEGLFAKTDLGQIMGRSEYNIIGLFNGQLADAFKADLIKYRKISGEN